MTSSVQTVRFRPKNAAGEYGAIVEAPIGTYTATGVSLRVSATAGLTQYTIYWSGTGTITYSTDGVSFFTPPTSGFTVLRTTSDQALTFQAVLGSQITTDTITIPALGKGMDVPDLSLTPGTLGATSVAFQARSINPNGGADLSFTVTAVNCTFAAPTSGATSLTSSGLTGFTINRPAHNNTAPAYIRVRSSISGGGAEEFTVPIPNVTQDNPGAITVDVSGSTGSVAISFNGPSTCNSWRYAYSTVGYPSDASAAAGTVVTGRQNKVTLFSVLASLGQTVYVTAIPYTDSIGGGIAHPSCRGEATWQTKGSTKTLRIPAMEFMPVGNDVAWNLPVYLEPTNLSTFLGAWAPLTLPAGALITAVRFRFYSGDAAASCTGNLSRYDDNASGATIASLNSSPGAGWHTAAAGASEVRSASLMYAVHVFLSNSGSAFARLLWAEVDYTVSSLDQSI
jgi:hypothetical protein